MSDAPEKRKQRLLEAGRGFKQQGVEELKRNYHIDHKTKVLGVGSFGKVFLTTNKIDRELKFAIKVLDKDRMRDDLAMVFDEIATLHMLDHPNIVKYFETYNDQRYIYLVMEYVSGKPLF